MIIMEHNKVMIPRSHYEERFTYYDSVQIASFTLKDFCTYYFGKERENKRKIYFETLKIHHKHLYDLEIEKEKGKREIFFTKELTT